MNELVFALVFLVLIVVLYLFINNRHTNEIKNITKKLKFLENQKEYAAEAMFIYAKNHEIIFANRAAKKLFSLKKNYNSYIFKNDVQFIMTTSAAVEFLSAIDKKSKMNEDNFHLKNSVIAIDGKEKVVNIYVDISNLKENGTITCLVDTHTKIKEIIKNDGKVDFLTGLPSQFSALSDINYLVLESQKKSETFSLFLLGVDNYANMEATLGKSYTNQMLQNMASYFMHNNHLDSTLYKMDCDKFLFIIKNIEDEETVENIAKEMITDIDKHCKSDINTHVTISFGIAHYPKHGENFTKLINNCYFALDSAQKKSISNIEIFKTNRKIMHKDDLQMNKNIISGLKNREFLLYYQPVFNLKTEKMIAAEALIRWNHPKEGLISPIRFLSLAEKTGLIVDLGAYVFREAIKQRKQWDVLGFPKFKITLNLSLREMKVDKLIHQINILFDEYSVDPMNFSLDISETSVMTNIDKTIKDLHMFKEAGLSISLDNFGSGYSSIKHLQTLPISMLKIDRSLISDLVTNINTQTTVKAIINLAHTLDYEVVAEGVESAEEVKVLKELNCNHAQGYFFSKPVPVFEFQQLLREM